MVVRAPESNPPVARLQPAWPQRFIQLIMNIWLSIYYVCLNVYYLCLGRSNHSELAANRVVLFSKKHGYKAVPLWIERRADKSGAIASRERGSEPMSLARAVTLVCEKGGKFLLNADRMTDGIDTRDANDNTLLIVASAIGSEEVVEWLIERGANVNARTGYGDTPILYASSCGSAPIVRRLIRAGASIYDRNIYGCTPIMYAASSGDYDSVSLLLREGAGLEDHNDVQYSLLMMAVFSGDERMVQLLIDRGVSLNDRDIHGRTALMHAIRKEKVEIIRLLLEANCEVDNTTWLLVCASQNLDIVRLFQPYVNQ